MFIMDSASRLRNLLQQVFHLTDLQLINAQNQLSASFLCPCLTIPVGFDFLSDLNTPKHFFNNVHISFLNFADRYPPAVSFHLSQGDICAAFVIYLKIGRPWIT